MNKTYSLPAPDAFVFMKVGMHAKETLEEILERKQREILSTGMSFWGYGGSCCHPTKQVQPFAEATVKNGGGIYMLMEYIDSKADPQIVPATEYSKDGVTWEAIPKGIQVTGSKYAIVLDEIMPGELDVDLEDHQISIGPSQGKNAAKYIAGRVDKGCMGRIPRASVMPHLPRIRKVTLVAKMAAPYAVFVRGNK